MISKSSILIRMGRLSGLAVLCFFALYWVAGANAQVETTSALRGIVTDPADAVIPGASVVTKNVNTGETRTLRTNGQGAYSLPSVSPGTYTITVTKNGFKTGVITGRVLEVGQPAEVDVVLQLGSSAQSITVSAAGAELLNTSTGEVSSLVSSRLVQNVPLNGRDFFDLAALTPGATPQNLTTTQITFSQKSLNFVGSAGTFVASGIVLAGNRDSATNVSVDGSNVQSPVYQQTTQLQSPDDIQEMKIESGNMNAEFGNGITAVNIVTKSGTNQLHGTAYEYYRNDIFDANGYFNNLASQKIPNYRVDQFGGAVGGPIRRNKLLFFANYEGYRLNTQAFSQETVPDDNIRTGDFSQYHLITGSAGNLVSHPTPTIYNPYSFDPVTGLRTPFPGNKIPLGPTTLCSPRPTCVDPVMLAFLQSWVAHPNGVFNETPVLQGTAPTTITRKQATGRIDWLKSEKTNIYGRYTYSTLYALAGGLQPLEGTTNPASSQNGVIHWTESISASIANDLMVAYSRPVWTYGANPNAPDVSAQIGLQNVPKLPGGPSIANGFNMDSTGTFNLHGTDNKIQLKDDLSTVRGLHNFRFGGEILNNRFFYPTKSNFKGSFGFTPVWSTACPGGNTACAAAQSAGGLDTGGLSFADYLLGSFSTDLLQVNSIPYRGRQTYFGVYAQDSWRPTANLTLNYGLRYEHWSPWLVPNNTTVGFNFATGNIQYTLQNPLDYLDPKKCFGGCAPLTPGVPRQGYTTGGLNFGPRVGLAYSLNPTTVARASFGIFYDGNSNGNQFTNIQTGAAPFFSRVQTVPDQTSPLPPALAGQQFSPPSPTGVVQPNSTPPSTFRFVMPHYPTPTVQQWSASVQHTLGTYWALETDYLGSHTTHQMQFIDVNAPALPQGPLVNVPIQQRRPYPQWGPVQTWAPIGFARYNALTASLKNREWHGLSLTVNFTWAKGIVSSDFGFSDEGQTNFRDPYMYAGSSPVVPNKFFVTGYSYELPFGQGRVFAKSLNPVLNQLVAGWLVSGITTFSTGSPQPVMTFDESNTGQGISTPNLVPGCDPRSVPGGKNRFEWFNTSCFVTPPFGTYGNSKLGAITEPGINNWDISLDKVTHVGFPKETGTVEIRIDAFNAINHTQWGPPVESFTSPSVGQITTTRDPRILQLAARYRF